MLCPQNVQFFYRKYEVVNKDIAGAFGVNRSFLEVLFEVGHG